MDQVKNTYAWKEAVELSLELIRICEEFTDNDRNVLVGHLRQAVVDIPATVAADIKHSRGANLEPIVKLLTELELVHKVYPAVDTGSAPDKAAQLLQRMESSGFHEQIAAEAGTDTEDDSDEPEAGDQDNASDQDSGTVEEEQADEPEAQVEEEVQEPQPEPKAPPKLIQINTDNS